MPIAILMILAVSLVLGGCSTTPPKSWPTKQLSKVDGREVLEERPAGLLERSATQDSEPRTPIVIPASAPKTSDTILGVFQQPEFQRDFALSYQSETEVEPRISVPEREQLQKIMDAISGDRIDEATALLDAAQAGSASAVFDFTAANLYFQKERLDDALPAYERAVSKFPKFRRAWRNIGMIHVRKNDLAKAVPAFTKVIELGGGDAVTYGLLGFAYSSIENPISAESSYRMAILLDPGTLDWKMGLARSLFKQRRFADAASLCGTLLATNPDRADLLLLQANAYIGLNQPMKAAENFELAERMGKSTTDSLNMLGDIYVNAELFDLGVGAYSRAIERDPKVNPDRALRAAKVLTAKGALEEVSPLLDRLASMNGGEQPPELKKEILKLRARIAVAKGAGDDEVRLLEEIVALDPLDGEALILLGQHHQRKGDPEKAMFHFERAASLDAFEADAKVRMAQLLVAQAKYAEALPLLRRAQALKPREHLQDYLEQVERVSQGR